jgi:hypothetical protein
MDDLAAFLAHRRECNQRPVRDETGFLGELAACRGGEIAVRPDEPLGNRPGACVLARPKRATRMPEQHFEVGLAAKHQKPGADLVLARHGRKLSPQLSTGWRRAHRDGARPRL